MSASGKSKVSDPPLPTCDYDPGVLYTVPRYVQMVQLLLLLLLLVVAAYLLLRLFVKCVLSSHKSLYLLYRMFLCQICYLKLTRSKSKLA